MVVGWFVHTRQDGAEEYSDRVFRDRNRSISAGSDSLAVNVILANPHHNALAEALELGLINQNKLLEAALADPGRWTYRSSERSCNARAFNKRPEN